MTVAAASCGLCITRDAPAIWHDARLRVVPVVMLTADSAPATVADLRRLKVSGYLLKPVSPKDLSARLTAALQRKQ